jgi:tRNA U34 5-carboxymethylaminomethyl modifying GTPase MnmE/TrmE
MLEKALVCLIGYTRQTSSIGGGDGEMHHDYAMDAEELRLAAKWLGNITGHISTEDVLDVIFKDFCIGK